MLPLPHSLFLSWIPFQENSFTSIACNRMCVLSSSWFGLSDKYENFQHHKTSTHILSKPVSSSLISLDAGACQQFLFVYFSLFSLFFSFLLFSHPNTQMQPTGFHTMTSRMKCVPLPIDQDQHEVRTSDLGIVYETYLLAESG